MDKIQFQIEIMGFTRIVTGVAPLVALLVKVEDGKGITTISSRQLRTVTIPTQVITNICKRLINGESTVFQYLGESFIIDSYDNLILFIMGANTHLLYWQDDCVKTNGTTYTAVFYKGNEYD